MTEKKMTIREKLEMMKEMAERNEKRRREFIEDKKKRDINATLFDMLVNGEISREEFERKFKK